MMPRYRVRTDEGVRLWHADDAEHAREQHIDAFADEAILDIQRMPESGDVVEVTGLLPGDPDPLPIGLQGTVKHVTPDGPHAQIWVDWHDSTRSLMLLPGDPFRIVSHARV